ncbi:MAG TPA: sulfur carrier protein ThiS [Adhaeribacter sp.]|nr:sulfur carrier protein ThiS [Adhaeribacter sp.]
MEISVNHAPQSVTDNCSLQQLLEIIMPSQQKGFAVAVNNAIVPKAEWAGYLLDPLDKVLIIRATQGG